MAPYRDDKSTDLPLANTPLIPKPRKARRSRLVTAVVVSIISFGLLFLLHGLLYPPQTPSVGPPEYLEDYDSWTPPPFKPTKRYSLGYGSVACWQNDGVWIGHLTPVELSHLGINRFNDTERSPIQAEEDAFCARLRMYGASFWSLPPRWVYPTLWSEDIRGSVEPAYKVELELGFPESGGMWVLNTTQVPDGELPKFAGLRNALTMEERCNVLEDMGAKFCESMEACPETEGLTGMEHVMKAVEIESQTPAVEWWV